MVWTGQGNGSPLTDQACLWAGPGRLGDLVVDPGNARITFTARMFGVHVVHGSFAEFLGVVRYDAADPEHASLSATVRAASIDTGIALRDRHLRGWSYLDVVAHPTITFRSYLVVPRGACLSVRGALTLRGVTTEEELACISWALPPAERAGGGYLLAGLMTIRRSAFGIGRPSPSFGPLDIRPHVIGDEVHVRVEVRVPAG